MSIKGGTRGVRGLATIVAVATLLLGGIARGEPIKSIRDKPMEWYSTPEARQILDNIVSWQKPSGGWWKTYDITKPHPGQHPDDRYGSTFDNNATWSEMRALAKGYTATGDEKYRQAFDRAFKMVLEAQYDNGGWPQQWPLKKKTSDYAQHITFNDDAMTKVMWLLKDIAEGKDEFAFVSDEQREQARKAFERGVQCILDAQVRIDGELTVWCAQHDAETLEPTSARTYELPSLSGGESADILMLLMSIEEPSNAVKESVQAGVKWYDRVKVTGLREERIPDSRSPKGFDVVMVEDPSAPPLWGRFYDLETGKPFFAGRDGVKKDSIADIEMERRAGYAWLRPWGRDLLEEYPEWTEKHGVENVLQSSD